MNSVFIAPIIDLTIPKTTSNTGRKFSARSSVIRNASERPVIVLVKSPNDPPKSELNVSVNESIITLATFLMEVKMFFTTCFIALKVFTRFLIVSDSFVYLSLTESALSPALSVTSSQVFPAI